MTVIGVDIGGSGIKGAPVDTQQGVLSTDWLRIKTPQPATPDAVLPVVAEIVGHFSASDVVGMTFPGVVRGGVVDTAPNMHPSWIGVDLPALVASTAGLKAVTLNDADAAIIAESAYGAARGCKGLVVLLTFGTGVGSGMVIDGQLIPNTEIGHLELGGEEAERQVAESVRQKHDWSWKKWAKRTNDYLAVIEALFSPDLLLIGGGIDKAKSEWLPLLKTRAPLEAAALGNKAGVIGAARHAELSAAVSR